MDNLSFYHGRKVDKLPDGVVYVGERPGYITKEEGIIECPYAKGRTAYRVHVVNGSNRRLCSSIGGVHDLYLMEV